MRTFNKIIFIIIIFLFSGINLFASDDNMLLIMKKANKLYQDQNYDEALLSYKSILHTGLESSELYYNIGNTYYRIGKLGYAILNYEKALKLSPGDEDIKYNLRIAYAHSVDKIEEIPQVFLIEWWNSLVMLFTVSGWSIISILIYILFISLIGVYYYFRNSSFQKPAFMAGVVTLSVLIIVSILFINRITKETGSEYGILVENTANVKVSPDDKSNDAFIIHEGIKFVIEDKVNDWSKIKLNDGKIGWLTNNYFKSI
ncbi:MAG: tetratricopeptide repeat protein [bacterium]